MSSMEHHAGRLTEISLEEIGPIAKINAYNANKGEMEANIVFTKDIYGSVDIEDEGFFYHDAHDSLYKVTLHEKHYHGVNRAYRIDHNVPGQPKEFVFSLGFYNGGTHFSEMLQEQITGAAYVPPIRPPENSAAAHLWSIVAAKNGWKEGDAQIWHVQDEVDEIVRLMQLVRKMKTEEKG